MERFRKEHGHRSVIGMKKKHVEALMEKKRHTPAAANKLRKLIGRLCRYAINEHSIAMTDPTQGGTNMKTNIDGYHTWTDAEIKQFEAHHGEGSTAILVLHLVLNTGASRQDVNRMGWVNICNNRFFYSRGKKKERVNLSVLTALHKVLNLIPTDQETFICQTKSKRDRYTTESFGKWFGDRCIEANVPGRLHGLRKAGATRLAEAGATEFEIMTFLGHKTPKEAQTYVK